MKGFLKKVIVWILTIESQIVLWKYGPRIVGITGSVGKTTAKDAVYEVLSRAFYVRASEKSFNSEIGIPLTILDAPNAWGSVWGWFRNIIRGLALITLKSHYPKWLVLELGIDSPGDMKRITKWLSLDVAIITHLGRVPVHVEFFDSPEHLKKEKLEILSALGKDGTLILNADDPELQKVRENSKQKTITYGFSDTADVRATALEVKYSDGLPSGINFKAEHGGNIVPMNINGVLGRQHVYPVLAALAAGLSQDVNMVRSSEGFKKYTTAPGRMRILDGVDGTALIDDSYNSSPAALEEALKTLENIKIRGRKIAVLGDMKELGKHSENAHREAGRLAGKAADILLTVGPDAEYIADEAISAGLSQKNVYRFDDSIKAGKHLTEALQKGDTVLIKGSQAVRLERVVEAVMANPDQKKKLLVRQDEEWGRR